MIIFLGRTHLIIGLIISIGLIWLNSKIGLLYFNLLALVLFIAMFEFGSIFPDVDKDNSIVGKRVKEVSSIINLVFGHRGLFHNIYFYSVICVVLLILIDGNKYGLTSLLGFYFGAISHIVEDMVYSKVKKEIKRKGII